MKLLRAAEAERVSQEAANGAMSEALDARDPELLKEARRGDGKGQSRLISDISAAAVR
ncbi:hypothetical protein IYX23_18960 [Methylocystis sp. L43]|uniref:hypothetical protein n=1 Tax=unclassified Methylocystis TaxID=2625913 RepID=UPI0018C2A33A|nr:MULTISPECIES: hypothetical protein [unclassified Methylocystis]MBG0799752.1 hypothetical protein [Methylocystis sp. L43]MBG0807535.1 hypothetical protein [Methylocystis sp. H15]